MRLWKFIAITLLFLWAVPPLAAHTVILRNGQVLYGDVNQQDRKNIYLVTKNAKKTIPKRIVLKILFQEVKDEPAIKKIIRTEIAKKRSATEDADIEIVDFNEYMKEVLADEKRRELRLGMTWRNAIMPGWGHWHGDQPIHAGIYGTLYVASLGAAVNFYMQNRNAYKDYNDSTVPALIYVAVPGFTGILVRSLYYGPLRERVSTTARNTKTAYISAFLIWTGSLINAYFFTPSTSSSAEETALHYELLVDSEKRADVPGPGQWRPDTSIAFRLSLNF